MKRLSGVPRPAGRLLEARLLVYLGRDAEARRLFEEMAAGQAEATRTGDGPAIFIPSEQVLLRLVDLCTRDATDKEWADLHARARTDAYESEAVEVVEMTALTLARRGQLDRARATLEEALALAEKIPNVMGKRLAQAQARLRAAAGATVSRAG